MNVKKNGKIVLITGGAGFIGSHVVRDSWKLSWLPCNQCRQTYYAGISKFWLISKKRRIRFWENRYSWQTGYLGTFPGSMNWFSYTPCCRITCRQVNILAWGFCFYQYPGHRLTLLNACKDQKEG
jgi:hypothetical protein